MASGLKIHGVDVKGGALTQVSVVIFEPCSGCSIAHVMQMFQKCPFRVDFTGYAERFEFLIRVNAMEQHILVGFLLQISHFKLLLQMSNEEDAQVLRT